MLLRGGLLPKAYVYPAERRATRALRRRRIHLPRKRADLLAHVQQTNSQDNRPESGKKRASKANRDGVAARCRARAVQTRVEVDRALMDYDDQRRSAVEWTIVQTAQPHQAQTLSRRHSIPGLGKMVRVVLRYASQESTRFPRGQDVVSYCRLVQCATDSAGQRDGTAGAKLGHPYLQGAFPEAAGLFLRHNPAAPNSLVRLESKPGKGKALTLFAPKWARAVYDMRKRDPTFNLQQSLNGSGSGAAEPTASLDEHGLSLARGCADDRRASGNAWEHIGSWAPIPRPVIGHPLRLWRGGERRARYLCAAPPPNPERPGQRAALNRHVASDGMRARIWCEAAEDRTHAALHSPSLWR